MDDLIEELKEAGTFSPAEMRWAEHLRDEEFEESERERERRNNFEWEPNPRLTWRQNYEMYLQSNKWWRTRGIAIYLAKNKCARCGWQSPHFGGRGLEVHHKTYKHLGDEPMDDLEVLCQKCHKIADKEREERHHVSHD